MAPSMTLPLGLGIFGDVVFTHAALVRPARNLAALIAVLLARRFSSISQRASRTIFFAEHQEDSEFKSDLQIKLVL